MMISIQIDKMMKAFFTLQSSEWKKRAQQQKDTEQKRIEIFFSLERMKKMRNTNSE